MKLLVIFALVALAVAHPQDDDDDGFGKYENFNVVALISDLRLFRFYVNCFVGNGICTPEGVVFKRWIADVFHSSCQNCSTKQKSLIAKLIRAIMEKLPEEWEKLNHVHNPDGSLTAKLKDFLEKNH